MDVDAKRFELLTQLLAEGAQRVAIVYDAEFPESTRQLPVIETVAASAGLELVLLDATGASPDSFEMVLRDASGDVDAVFMLKVWGTSPRWFQWAFERGIPSAQDEIFDESLPQPLLSYGPSFESMGRQAARLADQILKGADPRTLPFETPDLFLSVDLAVAEAMGYEIPDAIVNLADEIRRSDLSLYALDLTGASDTVDHEPGTGACASPISTMGGDYIVCLNLPCAEVQDGGGIVYGDKVDVGVCTRDQLTGICATADYDMYYYNADPATLRIGCGFMGGNWLPEGEAAASGE